MRLYHWIFEWDRATGFSCDRLNYGPIGPSSCSWIIPGSICEEEPDEDDDEPYSDEDEE